VPSVLGLAAAAVPRAVTQPVRTAQLLGELALGAWRRQTAAPAEPDPGVDRSARVTRSDAPATRFNVKITGSRRVSLLDLPFQEVRQLGSSCDATVNDVLVAVVGGAVREYLLRHDELPEQPLVAFVPVSTRGDGDDEGGNRTSLMYASMATHLDDPVERLQAVAASTKRSKSVHKRAGAGVPTDLTAVAGPRAAGLIGKALADRRLVDRLRLGGNVVVSNIPGPATQLYLAGIPVERLYPFGPVIEGNALNVTVLSYKRELLSLGIVGDRKAVPDIEDLAADFHASFEALRKAVRS
jgi:WS/DGAT/MGAT family acyltransferase